MKTPRETLLKRHQSIEPKLDRMWAENLAPELRSNATPARGNVFLAAGWKLWCELILPSRRIWAGLACAWVAIAVLNAASSDTSSRVVRNVAPPSREDTQALIEQRRMLAQLIGPLAEPSYPQKPTAPGPRSDRAAQTSAA
jgi:hypothetical protein